MHPERFVAASAIAVIVTLVAILSLRPLAPRLGLLDRPNERKRHRGKVPLIGGLCFFLGTLAGLVYFGVVDRFVLCLLAVGALILLTGLLDDLDDLGARTRLVIQSGAVGLVILATDIHIDGGGYLIGGQEFRLYALGIPLTLIAVVGLINAFNMLDGIDGLAAGLAITSIAAIFAFIGVGWPTVGVALLLQILAVSLLPYLCVNLGWPDGRKIFMGDAGSTLIGFMLGWSLIFLSQRDVARLAPVDVLWCVALPVMDTLAVMYRRIRSARSPLKPDRQHLHHLLLDAGYTQRRVLLLLVGGSAVLAGCGYALRNAPELASLVGFAVVLLVHMSCTRRLVARLGVAPRPGPVQANTHGVDTRRPSARGAVAAIVGRSAPPHAVRVLCVLDASPNSLKIAPIVQQLQRDERFSLKVCVTALPNRQSRQMLRLFDIQPDHVLDVLMPGKDLDDMSSAPVRGMRRVLGDCKPDVLLVHGDRLTTLAATLAAHFQNVPIACVDHGSPILDNATTDESEQAVRKITRTLVSLHFAATESAGQALLAAGVPQERVVVTGGQSRDDSRTVLAVRRDISARTDLARRFSFLRAGSPLLLVAHREPSEAIAIDIGGALVTLAERRPDIDIVCPLHPATREHYANHQRADLPNLHLPQPLDYLAFSYLLNAAYLVLAGSPEIQQEAVLWNKPVLMMRGAGTSPGEFIAGQHPSPGIDAGGIAECVMTLLSDQRAYEAMCFAAGPGGDRTAGLFIVQALANLPLRAASLAA